VAKSSRLAVGTVASDEAVKGVAAEPDPVRRVLAAGFATVHTVLTGVDAVKAAHDEQSGIVQRAVQTLRHMLSKVHQCRWALTPSQRRTPSRCQI
jgi:hypothetical protein